MSDITIHITDRQGIKHSLEGPTDMNMNIMELIRAYELAEEGTVGICGGMAMCPDLSPLKKFKNYLSIYQ